MSPTLNWSQFIGQYHLEHPGATEALLAASRNATGIDPYTWINAGIAPGQRVLDPACGSAPMHAQDRTRTWICSTLGIALRKIVAARVPTPSESSAGAPPSQREGRVQQDEK